MKNLILALSLLSSSAAMAATTAEADSLGSQQLDEIVVSAPRVVRKADMDVFYPNSSIVSQSQNGMLLLRNMMIPALTVNDVTGSVTTGGQSVQLRINGREATVEQVRNLLPETIRRIEWIDNPGLRYNGATAVINFIVSNPAAGGSLMVEAGQALNCAWGPYWSSVKLNNGRSQWGATVNYKLTNKIGSHREYEETFTYPDGRRLTRTETSLGGHMGDNNGYAQFDYSYIKPDTTVIWAAVYGSKRWSGATLYDGIMSMSDGTADIALRDYSDQKGNTPGISAYIEQHFAHNQVIAVDCQASFYDGRSLHSYTERVAADDIPVTDVNTSIRDRNRAYGVEADYIKKWDGSRLTAGVSYSANRNRSVYENMGGEIFHQRQDRVYLFAEYYRRIRKVTLTAGLGVQYTSFRFRETGRGSESWNLRPQFTATYAPSQSSQLRLNFTSWQSTPSLSETNAAPQQIDGFQWRIGNPELKTSSSYMLTLRYNYNLPRVTGTFGVRAFTSPDAIAPYIAWQGDRLVTTYENSRGLQNINIFLSPQIDVIPGWFNLSGTLRYRAERMRGTGYRLYNHNWSGEVTAMGTYRDFSLIVQYTRAAADLWGESITTGESMSLVALGYRHRVWDFMFGVLCPFTRYDRTLVSLNRYNTSETHLRLDMAPMPMIRISCNLQWGRQKRGADKIVNADVEVDRSTAGGR
ncbi:MAG: outer membrane beta-barrel protein [Bacteroidales bacterium]|nr:outer membrane beta-barrel protein [Bacteroidales bacterium]